MQIRRSIGLGFVAAICAVLFLTGCEDNDSSPQHDWSLYSGRWVGTGIVASKQRTITLDVSSKDGTVTIDDPGSAVESIPWNEEHIWNLGPYKGLALTSPTEGWYRYFATIELHRE